MLFVTSGFFLILTDLLSLGWKILFCCWWWSSCVGFRHSITSSHWYQPHCLLSALPQLYQSFINFLLMQSKHFLLLLIHIRSVQLANTLRLLFWSSRTRCFGAVSLIKTASTKQRRLNSDQFKWTSRHRIQLLSIIFKTYLITGDPHTLLENRKALTN